MAISSRRHLRKRVVPMWQYINKNPQGRSVGDCTVRAISTATGNGWMETYLDLCLFGLLMADMPSANAITTAYLKKQGFERKTIPHHEDIYCHYDVTKYKDVTRTRFNPFKNEPIIDASGLCYTLRQVVNTDVSRQVALLDLIDKHPKSIIFYNFDYELDILKHLFYGNDVQIAEWNGHKHQELPTGDNWVYLVQYTAGCEGWNCVKTDTIIFFSQNYSYKVMAQAAGRIDRLNTPFRDLYYYHLKSRSGIDLAISKALNQKRNFNEGKFVNGK